MNKTMKIWIIIACAAVGVGLIIVIALSLLGSRSLFNSNQVQKEFKIYSVDKDFSNISIKNTAYDIILLPSEDKKCRVECMEEEKLYHTVEVVGDTLTIEEVNKKKWFENIYFGFNPSNWSETTLTVYLPKEEYKNLFLKTTSGDIYAERKFTFADAELYNTSGNVVMSEITADSITAKSTSGNVHISNSDVKTELFLKSTSGSTKLSNTKAGKITSESTSGSVSLKTAEVKDNVYADTTSGSIRFTDVKANDISVKSISGDAELTNSVSTGRLFAKTVSGDIELESCDGKKVNLESTSGEIEGSLLTGKKFITDTTSGNVNVPDNSGTDECVISTTSGDIDIYIIK